MPGYGKKRICGWNAADRAKPRLDVSPLSALLTGLLLCLGKGRELPALLLAAAVHEAGHLLLLRCCRRRITAIRVTLTGLELRCAGDLDGNEGMLCLLAGPAAGVLYAVLTAGLPSAFWQQSAMQSYALSVFNLLPILPLDGGRLVSAATDERFAAAVSRWMAAALLLLSVRLSFLRFSPLLLLMSAWLLFYGIRSSRY